MHGTSLFESLPQTADKLLPLNQLLVTHLNNASHKAGGFIRQEDLRSDVKPFLHLSSMAKWIKDKIWVRALLWGRTKPQSLEVVLPPKRVEQTTAKGLWQLL